MSELDETIENIDDQAASAPGELSGGTYEIIRKRLGGYAEDLRKRLAKLNAARKDVFGSIELKLITQERITTDNNCMPQDIFSVGDRLLFGYNVHLGLRSETLLKDVFAGYIYKNHTFENTGLDIIADKRFEEDFKNLYRYYRKTTFSQFAVIGSYLHMVFRTGEDATAIKTFKWLINENNNLTYVDNRSDHEYRFPPQHEFEWTRVTRDQHRSGAFPHVSIADRVFVETTGGDLTIKVEDNTDTGAGIYAEPVEDPDQTLDDAEFYYSIVGNLIFLKILPYREKQYRYIVYNEKVQEARRIDAIEDACVLLPEEHGIIFANGYYLKTSEFKQFENKLGKMLFSTRISSSNGEDTLYAFYNRYSGTYVLLSYNLIEQRVDTPIICNGYSLFENGEMIYFRTQDQPSKNHPIQVWQTPYVGPNYVVSTKAKSYLFKIGNRDIVRCMAACRAILNLIVKDESFTNLFVDIVREATQVIDMYFWLDKKDAFEIKVPLVGIKETAHTAIEQFEKTVRIKKETARQIAEFAENAEKTLGSIRTVRFEHINEFVDVITKLRTARGTAISLKDLRYVDLQRIETLEEKIAEQTDQLSAKCVEFLLTEASLHPYELKVAAIEQEIGPLAKVAEAKELDSRIGDCGAELDMLIEIVSNLKIGDATKRTQIIDSISAIYSVLNRARSRVKNKIESLASSEGKAEFASQIKLLDQTVINYLDVCDTPQKCEEYLTKITVQISEIEGKFSDFSEFIVEIADKQSNIYNTFETRKLSLVEARNKKTDALQRSAERVLHGMATRVSGLSTVEEINGYFASDFMVEKVRDIIRQLTHLGDSIKAGDIQARLKTLHQDTLRQLKDTRELYEGGKDVIKLGKHRFSVNTQELAITIVRRDDKLNLHLTGTNFLDEIPKDITEHTKSVWDQSLVSENDEVYRGEYLAFLMMKQESVSALDEIEKRDMPECIAAVNRFMSSRYAEGYVKGVHDQDGALILKALLKLRATIGFLKYSPSARALAALYWHHLGLTDRRGVLELKLGAIAEISRLFEGRSIKNDYIGDMREDILVFLDTSQLFDPVLADEAAAYLFDVLVARGKWAISPGAAEIYRSFWGHLERRGDIAAFSGPIEKLGTNIADGYRLTCDWVSAFIEERGLESMSQYLEEVAALLLTRSFDSARIVDAKVSSTVEGLVGHHKTIKEGRYELDYNNFVAKLRRYSTEVVPLFTEHQELKKRLIEEATIEMRLDEFRPRVLSTFVRNRLIDTVYLPMIGENLAKQLGVVGENTRTDRMGLLLLISPPGYGKTTLMEYIANRLGIIFMKINGPAIGNRVTSLDPAEAPNAAASEELKKLNLSLEMGDNVMIYLDDIQHCNPELLQKFISMCDAQRKIEGVFRGKTRTYDLRGRKVCVVMAGNPYSESGEAFKIPDMLANRADTYNLGDIIGDNADVFKLSYLENCLTSNPVLSQVASKNFQDIYGILQTAASGTSEGIEFESNYSAAELDEYVSVSAKLLRVRDVILKVNQEYIYSAAQADEYRTEPPFKLQGSYRNMNRIAEKILPVMNDRELEQMINAHYESESQTLTTAAESNLLKFKELIENMTDKEKKRWEEIKLTFNRNLMMAGAGGKDRMGQMLVQLEALGNGIGAIEKALSSGSALKEELSALQMTIKDGITQLSKNAELTSKTIVPVVHPKVEATIADDTMHQILRILGRLQAETKVEK